MQKRSTENIFLFVFNLWCVSEREERIKLGFRWWVFFCLLFSLINFVRVFVIEFVLFLGEWWLSFGFKKQVIFLYFMINIYNV